MEPYFEKNGAYLRGFLKAQKQAHFLQTASKETSKRIAIQSTLTTTRPIVNFFAEKILALNFCLEVFTQKTCLGLMLLKFCKRKLSFFYSNTKIFQISKAKNIKLKKYMF